MVAMSEEFRADLIAVCGALERQLDPRDVGTPLHAYLADRICQCRVGEFLEERGLLTADEAKEYRRAREDRDSALAQLGFDRDPLTIVVRTH